MKTLKGDFDRISPFVIWRPSRKPSPNSGESWPVSSPRSANSTMTRRSPTSTQQFPRTVTASAGPQFRCTSMACSPTWRSPPGTFPCWATTTSPPAPSVPFPPPRIQGSSTTSTTSPSSTAGSRASCSWTRTRHAASSKGSASSGSKSRRASSLSSRRAPPTKKAPSSMAPRFPNLPTPMPLSTRSAMIQ